MSTAIWASPNYTGYSGAPGRGTCAGSCHGTSGGTIQVNGFPTQYTPGQTYQIIVRRASGTLIRNFNASCRVGAGTQNAGVISSGIRTSTYNTSGETNGVHLSSSNQDTCTFDWQAPTAGTGTVRLYLAGLQGGYSGNNTVLVLISNEASSLPGQASNPTPADGDTGVVVSLLEWTVGSGTTLQALHFGTSNPPAFVDSIGADTNSFPVQTNPGTTYFWSVDEVNEAGVAVGAVWRFTTMTLPAPATDPIPPNDATVDQADTLRWTVGSGTIFQNVYFGTVIPPELVTSLPPDQNFLVPATIPGTRYFWRVDEHNLAGVTTGDLWSFTIRATAADVSLAVLPADVSLGPVYPNPFNSAATIVFTLPRTAEIDLSIFDLTGKLVRTLTSGRHGPGEYQMQWRAERVPSGLYFARLSSGSDVRVTKLALMK